MDIVGRGKNSWEGRTHALSPHMPSGQTIYPFCAIDAQVTVNQGLDNHQMGQMMIVLHN